VLKKKAQLCLKEWMMKDAKKALSRTGYRLQSPTTAEVEASGIVHI